MQKKEWPEAKTRKDAGLFSDILYQKKALAGIMLQKRLPKARILYVSATFRSELL